MSDSYWAARAAAPSEMFGEPDEPCPGCGDDGSYVGSTAGWRWVNETDVEPCPECNPSGRHYYCNDALPTVDPRECTACWTDQ